MEFWYWAKSIFSKVWGWIKSAFSRAWEWIKWLLGKIWKPSFLLIILVAVWVGFLKLVSPPPLYTTPALIMVWASATVLILALYPNILERIKGLKIGDFEIEFQEAVQTAATDKFISISSSDLDNAFFLSQKGSLRSLQPILSKAILERNKPVLLVVNLSGDSEERQISIPMLFVYLFFIDIFSKSSIVLFVSSSRRSNKSQNISELKKNEVIGLISGHNVIRQFYQQFPNLLRLWSHQRSNRNSGNQNDIFEGDGFFRIPSRRFIEDLYERARNLIGGNNENSEYLTNSKVKEWFGDYLSKRAISNSPTRDDLDIMKEILLQRDEYFLIVKGGNLETIVITCNLTANLSKKIVDYLYTAK